MAPKASGSKKKSGLGKMRDADSGSENTSEVKGRKPEKQRMLDTPEMGTKASGSKKKGRLMKKTDVDSGMEKFLIRKIQLRLIPLNQFLR